MKENIIKQFYWLGQDIAYFLKFPFECIKERLTTKDILDEFHKEEARRTYIAYQKRKEEEELETILEDIFS